MGCDIHVRVECKNYDRSGWTNYDLWRKLTAKPDCYSIEPIYDARNYTLFAYLSNVRNYAGVEDFRFDRGLPEDVSAVTKAEYDELGFDAHTPGYCTLAELKKKATSVKTIHRSGMVRSEAAEAYKKNGTPPQAWCRSTNMDGYVFLEWDDPTDTGYVFGRLIQAIERRLAEINAMEIWNRRNEDEIRIVFWYDN